MADAVLLLHGFATSARRTWAEPRLDFMDKAVDFLGVDPLSAR